MLYLVSALLATAAVATVPSLKTARTMEENVEDACKLAPGDITQSTDCGIVAGTGLSCGYPVGNVRVVAGPNHFLRRFLLSKDHQITGKFDVKNLQFGIEEIVLTPTTPQMPLAVNCYSIPTGAAMAVANLVLAGNTTVMADASATGTLFSAAVSCTVDGSANDLVVEFVAPDYKANTAQQGSFYPGANTAGELEDGYIFAPECGISDATTFKSLGYTVDLAMIVSGAAENEMMELY